MTEPTVPTNGGGAASLRCLVTMEHVNATYEGIPDSEVAIVPGTSPFLLQEKPALCNDIIVQFLTEDAVPTVAPIRRAG